MRAPDGPASRIDDDVLEVGGKLAARPSELLIATAFTDELKNQQALFEAVGLADMAHTLVMSAPGPIPKKASAALLKGLLALQRRPKDFVLDPARGDIYTNREAWLNTHCNAAGWLGVSRARREAVTCGFHLMVRKDLLSLAEGLEAVALALGKTARKHRSTLFPDYTYLQAAQPTTFAHYLLGFAFPVVRHIERTLALFARFNVCPAGGGSANGSIARQDRAKLSRLLGFAAPTANTRDSMWQADIAIEAAGLTANALITLDRLAEDLMVFTTREFGLVALSDRHSRASKIMPQKKNPFALSYLRALANYGIGLQTTITASMRTPSGQMDNRLAAYAEIPAALRQATQAAYLMAEVVTELKLDRTRAKVLIERGQLSASDLAEHVMLASNLNFRQGHKVVGHLVHTLDNEGRSLASATPHDLDRASQEAIGKSLSIDAGLITRALDAKKAVEARTCIGGAAPKRVDEAIATLNAAIATGRRVRTKYGAKIAKAEAKLIATARTTAGRG